MCGVIGLFGNGPVNQSIYDGLTVLQHRGQDAAGIVTHDTGRLFLRKQGGLVRDAFQTKHMVNLRGHMGAGHVRYPTAGCHSSAEAQPFYVNSPYGIALGHNGNLINTDELREYLYTQFQRHVNTDSDSEILLNLLAVALQRSHHLQPSAEDIFSAFREVFSKCRGGYAGVAVIANVGLVGFRDPYGIRPLVFGQREGENGTETMIASESVAVDVLGFELQRDLQPGEVVFIDTEGRFHSKVCAAETHYSPCIFEFVYFARPDSIIDGISVHRARMRMGDALARKLLRTRPDHNIDVVIPIPETSRTAAMELAQGIGVPYREGFIKNRYIPRTFIMPGQNLRRKSVRQKLNAIGLEFRGKNVLLVDDSIVRGTTSTQIIEMAREAGARKVYLASAAPPVRHPNVYGIDMPAAAELIAAGRTEDEIGDLIGADWLLYQDLDDLKQAVRRGNPTVEEFDTSCFNGHYVTGGVSPEYLSSVAETRADGKRKDWDQALTDLTFVDAENTREAG